MENLGALAIILAFCFSIYAIVASLAGRWKSRPFLVASGERAIYAIFFLLTTAAGILIYSMISGDYRLSYVAQNSNRAMSTIYKFAAWWGGQSGSLLLWAWLLSLYSTIVTFQNRRKFRDMMPYAVAILAAVQCFFLILVGFVVSPFDVLMQGKGIVDVGDGQGLNPVLQYWTMVIHPPILYLGYVGFSVPFAFAMASLITRRRDDDWIHTTRRWSLVTWLFQSCGITLGAAWAYAALGWGGYWAWDPVENASLLPWLTSTAFLHSVMMQEKKGMMKVWNMVLVACTFWLCIFGTTLTRTGLVNSVHAFAQSSIGTYFFTFLAVGIAATIFLLLDRLDYMKTEARLESVLSRESSFMFNNLILVASCFSVLWGTLFPVISEAVTGEKISVDAPFFNKINIPIGLFLLLLTGVGPLIAWRRSSFDSLRRAFAIPTIGAVVLAAGLFAAGIRSGFAVTSFALCLFVTLTIASEFFKGSRAISARTGQNLIAAMAELTHRNTRRYGGYIVHMGIVIMFIGFTGKAFDKDITVQAAPGDTFKLGGYEMKVSEVKNGDNPNYVWSNVAVDVYSNGKLVKSLQPERRAYKASRQPVTEVAIWRRLNEDVYLSLAGLEGGKAIVQAYVFPLVSWIWIGLWVLVGGTLICMVPPKQKLPAQRTEPEPVRQHPVVREAQLAR